jgi:ABC-type uncharacterized transport system YnjBCD ATPase subunit
LSVAVLIEVSAWMRDINFTVRHGDIFIIMGGSGCGV